ncbi:alpha/beta hydrolase fold domain-containing protein [Dinghuibacter silviterrae]|uniref:Acetyl esterase/lipase n=1 Tax=Dinghuibacter silviterrae TaxID=1539049 RepID=A0A4R8DW15_9BACT|nr:alpha/beta hydrolase fold domain-containing protein [Dinghuibacter silviterrae]TDX02128.1 acetyl esterase/lipase [Dinghuibacter silviterrae]
MEDIQQRREDFDRKPRPYDYEPTVSIAPATINGVSCYWFTPEDPDQGKTIIYLHGGGFAMGSIRSHDKFVSHLAKKLQARTLFIEYALAPEKPWPAGIQDILSVYGEVDLPYLIGDSAGASLIVQVIGELLKRDLPLPKAAVLISPWIRLACDYPSYEANAAIDPVLTRDLLQMLARAYAGDGTLDLASPENVRPARFPPVLIMAGSNEILLDDSRHFYEYIKDIQPVSRLTIYEDQVHVWLRKDVYSTAGRRAFEEIAGFIRLFSPHPANPCLFL